MCIDAVDLQGSLRSFTCTDCVVGQYSNSLGGQSSCTSCAGGQYQGGTGQSSCLGCASGQYQGSTGGSSCSSCVAGQYQDAANQTDCIRCAAGRYVDVTGSAAASDCITCAAGQSTTGTGAMSSSVCTSCAAGEYAPSGAASCSACAAGTYITVTGSDADVATDCIPCDAGWFGTVTGETTPVSACPYNACPAGTFSPLASGACATCGAGHFTASSAQDSDGSGVRTGGTHCNPCPAGTFNSAGDDACDTCVAGHYTATASAEVEGWRLVSVLTPGSLQVWGNMSRCVSLTQPCAGRLSDFEALKRNNMLKIVGVADGVSDREVTFTGFSAEPWSFGFLIDYATGRRDIHTGGICDYGGGALGACNTAQNFDEGLSVTSAVGWTMPDQDILTTYTSSRYGGWWVCAGPSPCANSKRIFRFQYWAPAAGSIGYEEIGDSVDYDHMAVYYMACGEAEMVVNGSCHPVQPSVTNVTLGASICSRCPVGRFNEAGDSFCDGQCPAGKYSIVTGSTSIANCIDCASLTHQPMEGQSTCTNCPAGLFAASSGADNTGDSVLGASHCNSCPPAKFRGGNDTDCVICPAGHFTTTFGMDTDGDGVATVVTHCAPCPEGKSNAQGDGSCEICAAGRYSADGAASCSVCADGHFTTTSGSDADGMGVITGATHCNLCGVGRYNQPGDASCDGECPAGTFGEVVGAASAVNCTSCPSGRYGTQWGADNSLVCTSCVTGQFTASSGSDIDGVGVSTGATHCNSCPTGRYNQQSDGVCDQCPAGKYSAVTGASDGTVCIGCISGKYGTATGATTAQAACPYDNCPAGTASDGGAGCLPIIIVCRQPATMPAGYVQGPSFAEGNLDLSVGAFVVTGFECASGYEGVPTAEACETSGDYNITGCMPIVCAVPPQPVGYDFGSVVNTNVDLSVGPLDVSGISCSTGYSGAATAVACASGGSDYTATGCVCNSCMCTRPADVASVAVITEVSLASATFDVSVDACGVGYVGTPSTTVCAADGEYVIDGCSAIRCTQPALSNYTVQHHDLAVARFNVTAECAYGYHGSAQVAPCISSGDYTLSGCAAIVCRQPITLPAGYQQGALFAEGNMDLSVGAFDVTGFECTSGYEGSATAEACETSGDYNATGCTAIVCRQPATMPAGYVQGPSFAEGNLDLSVGAFVVTGFECASGYEGVPTAEACETSGDYNITGCMPIVCAVPPQPVGYDFGSVVNTNVDLSVGPLDVSGISCSTGYSGAATAVACASGGSDYTVAGCLSTFACDDSIATIDVNRDRMNLPSSCVGTVETGRCAHACHYGFEGGSVTCLAGNGPQNGTFVIVPCAAIMCSAVAPINVTDGYIVTEEQLSVPSGFDVAPQCATGYYGAAQATPCNSSGEKYTLTGCAAIVCHQPTTMPAGYAQGPSFVEGNLDLSAGDLNVTGFECATGYEGTATALPCVQNNGEYVLTGCRPPCSGTPHAGCYGRCDDDEPGTDTTMVELPANVCDGTADAAACTHACSPGYTGGAIACVASTGATNGAYTVVACVLSQAACSTITCADGWIADSAAAAALCASSLCDNTGGDNALCCDACTSQTGCAVDGVMCSAVSDLEDKLICDADGNANNVDADGTVTPCALGSILGAGQAGPCLALTPERCVANEYSDGSTCLPCAAGTTSAAATVDAVDGATTCAATTCAMDEFVVANACTACAAGYTLPAGEDASSSTAVCTLIPTTGMCTGNTDSSADVTCGAEQLAKPDPETIEGTDAAACCDDMPDAVADPPTVEYTWEATPWSTCAFGCGTRADSTRTVTCKSLTIYSTGAVVRATATDAAECTATEPAATQTCDFLAVDTPCDDNVAETTGDVCTAGDATGVCEGKQVLVSALTFDMDITTIDQSAAGAVLSASIKSSLSASLGSDIVVTILSIAAGSLVVDYKVEVPAATVVDQAAKDDAAAAIAGAAAIDMPAPSGGTVAAPTPIVEPFKSYAYVRSAGSCPSEACDAACGYVGLAVSDVYACQEDGVNVAASSCVGAGIGAAPETDTECCPAADDETCEKSAAEVTAPPPSVADVCAGLQGQEALDCVAEETGVSAGAIVGILVAVVVVGFVLAYCFCKAACSCIFGGGDEKPAAGGNALYVGGELTNLVVAAPVQSSGAQPQHAVPSAPRAAEVVGLISEGVTPPRALREPEPEPEPDYFDPEAGVLERQGSGALRRLVSAEDDTSSVGKIRVPKDKPDQSCRDVLLAEELRRYLPDVEQMCEDIEDKCEQLRFDAQEQIRACGLSNDELFAIVAYTYDSNTGDQSGQLYFEFNKALRDRQAAARKATTKRWGNYMFYLFAALEKIPATKGHVYRALQMPRQQLLADYTIGRPIQWGAFASTSEDYAAAAGFFDSPEDGVICKIYTQTGRSIAAFSHFERECEILLSPNCKFTVSSEPYERPGGYMVIDLIEKAGSEVFS